MQKIFQRVGARALVLLFVCAPTISTAAEYSVSFGELRGEDKNRIVPTKTIKLCARATGYKFGYEISPRVDRSYEYFTVFRLPAPASTVTFTNPDVRKGGKEIKTQTERAQGRELVKFVLDTGDPTGTWAIDVMIEGLLIQTIEFQVVSPESCP